MLGIGGTLEQIGEKASGLEEVRRLFRDSDQSISWPIHRTKWNIIQILDIG